MQKVMCNIYSSNDEFIFCPNHEDGSKPTGEEIIKCMTKEKFVGKFNNDDYEYADKIKRGKDDNTFITKNNDDITNVWKVFIDGVWDVNRKIIPGLYSIRKIGIIVEVGVKSLEYEK